MKSLQTEPTVNNCLLILDLKPSRSYIKGKHSIGRETSLQYQGMVTEKSCNLSE